MLDYMSVKEASEKWAISERQIQKLCVAGRIPGATRFSRIWLIPKDSEKPADRRYSENKVKIISSIDTIIREYGQYIYNLSLKLCANPQNAEDLAQETFIKAWKKIDTIKQPAAIKKWLRVICINEFRMMLRNKENQNIYFEDIDELEHDGSLLIESKTTVIDEIQTSEEVKKLRDGCFLAMTRKLTLNQRIAFSLIDMFGLSIKEVAEILDITPKAAKGLLYRARMNLESFFKGHCSFLDINNPCSCEAWASFMQDRGKMQAFMKQKIVYLDYMSKGYIYDPDVRNQILHFYRNMPEQRPSDEWFKKVILLVNNFYE